MDLQSLAVVLRAALSHVPEERKAAEASLTQVRSRSRAPARCSPLLDHALAPGTTPPPLSLYLCRLLLCWLGICGGQRGIHALS